jgi:hypothetical protein
MSEVRLGAGAYRTIGQRERASHVWAQVLENTLCLCLQSSTLGVLCLLGCRNRVPECIARQSEHPTGKSSNTAYQLVSILW